MDGYRFTPELEHERLMKMDAQEYCGYDQTAFMMQTPYDDTAMAYTSASQLPHHNLVLYNPTYGYAACSPLSACLCTCPTADMSSPTTTNLTVSVILPTFPSYLHHEPLLIIYLLSPSPATLFPIYHYLGHLPYLAPYIPHCVAVDLAKTYAHHLAAWFDPLQDYLRNPTLDTLRGVYDEFADAQGRLPAYVKGVEEVWRNAWGGVEYWALDVVVDRRISEWGEWERKCQGLALFACACACAAVGGCRYENPQDKHEVEVETEVSASDDTTNTNTSPSSPTSTSPSSTITPPPATPYDTALAALHAQYAAKVSALRAKYAAKQAVDQLHSASVRASPPPLDPRVPLEPPGESVWLAQKKHEYTHSIAEFCAHNDKDKETDGKKMLGSAAGNVLDAGDGCESEVECKVS